MFGCECYEGTNGHVRRDSLTAWCRNPGAERTGPFVPSVVCLEEEMEEITWMDGVGGRRDGGGEGARKGRVAVRLRGDGWLVCQVASGRWAEGR